MEILAVRRVVRRTPPPITTLSPSPFFFFFVVVLRRWHFMTFIGMACGLSFLPHVCEKGAQTKW